MSRCLSEDQSTLAKVMPQTRVACFFTHSPCVHRRYGYLVCDM